jgi:hypothetical protein
VTISLGHPGTSTVPFAFVAQSTFRESVPMNHTQGLLKETSDTWYLWASAGVSLAVIIAVVAL